MIPEQLFHHRALLAILAVILLVPLIFIDTTAQMVHVWNVNETFTHGYLIAPITLWLLWHNRVRLSGRAFEPELRPLLLLVMALIAWILGHVADVQAVKQLAMVGMIPVLVWLLLGRRILYLALFPIAYLFFTVPLGQGLIPPMMNFTADLTVFLIRLSGVPVFREGLIFSLPSGNWSVVEECSGVRYLIASLALGTLYAYVTYRSMRKRVLFILAAAVLPIVANGARAYLIVMLGHVSDMRIATGVDHLVYGWFFFGILIFVMFYVGSFWSDTAKATPDNIELETPATQTSRSMMFSLCLILAAISIVTVKVLGSQVSATTRAALDLPRYEVPENFEAWQRLADVDIGWRPEFQAPDIESSDAYRFGDEIVQVDLAYYHRQRQGAEAVSSANRITNPISPKWKLIRRVDLQIDDYYITESEIGFEGDKILVWHWYRIGSRQTPNAYIAKVFEAFYKIASGRHDAAMITVSTRLADLEQARTRLRRFGEVFLPEITRRLERLHG